jgi:hypothetical protein
MSQDDKHEPKVIKLVQRSLGKTVAGRQMRFVEPGAGAEAGLDKAFRADDASACVSELIAVCVVDPKLTPAEVATLSEQARVRVGAPRSRASLNSDERERGAASASERRNSKYTQRHHHERVPLRSKSKEPRLYGCTAPSDASPRAPDGFTYPTG